MSKSNITDTIFAIATPIGKGGIGIIRLSGPKSLTYLQKIFEPLQGYPLKPRYLTLGELYNKPKTEDQAVVLDQALAVYMPAPKSYTAEDVVEIQAHGGPILLNAISNTLLALGAKNAQPGEFTMRAFINGRLDLAQAEAIIDLIESQSEKALPMASAQLMGELSAQVAKIGDLLLDTLAKLELWADWPEETGELEHAHVDLKTDLNKALADLNQLLAQTTKQELYRNGLRVAIMGATNAGKSSLLNALLVEDRAIVTDIPGTTRDIITAQYSIKGIPITLIDTAGLRTSADPVEKLGIERSESQMAEADLLLWVIDSNQNVPQDIKEILNKEPNKPQLLLLNKADIASRDNIKVLAKEWQHLNPLIISAHTGAGLDQISQKIEAMVSEGEAEAGADQNIALHNSRQQEALIKARQYLQEALNALEQGLPEDMLAIDIQTAWESLGEITGETAADDIIDRVFDKFCLGK